MAGFLQRGYHGAGIITDQEPPLHYSIHAAYQLSKMRINAVQQSTFE